MPEPSRARGMDQGNATRQFTRECVTCAARIAGARAAHARARAHGCEPGTRRREGGALRARGRNAGSRALAFARLVAHAGRRAPGGGAQGYRCVRAGARVVGPGPHAGASSGAPPSPQRRAPGERRRSRHRGTAQIGGSPSRRPDGSCRGGGGRGLGVAAAPSAGGGRLPCSGGCDALALIRSALSSGRAGGNVRCTPREPFRGHLLLVWN